MNKMEKALRELAEMDELAAGASPIHALCAPAKLLTTLAYIVVVLSYHKYQLSGLVVLLLYPVLLFQISGVSVGAFFYKLRIVLPLVMAVAVFDPFFDREILVRVGGLGISGGVISMVTLMLKGVLCLMASFLMMATTPIDVLCAALRKFRESKRSAVAKLSVCRKLTGGSQRVGAAVECVSQRISCPCASVIQADLDLTVKVGIVGFARVKTCNCLCYRYWRDCRSVDIIRLDLCKIVSIAGWIE